MKVSRQRAWLFGGDIVTLMLVTGLGFATHQTLESAGLRMLTTFVPLMLAWLLVSVPLGAYDPEHLVEPRQLWRPIYAMALAAPMAAWLRSIWLGSAIVPIFVAVLAGVSALAILVWRVIFWFIATRRATTHG